MHHAHSAAAFAKQMKAFALARGRRQVEELLYAGWLWTGLAFLVGPKVEKKAL
jgi:hypothetical protein